MPEPIDLPAAKRAHYDRLLAEAVDLLLAEAADRDHLDVIEAQADLTSRLLGLFEPVELAATAAVLAIRLHRTTTEVAR